MAGYPTSNGRDLDLGLGHTAYRRASLMDPYLHAKFHWNGRNYLWTDGRTYALMDGPCQVQSHVTKTRPNIKNPARSNLDMVPMWSVARSHTIVNGGGNLKMAGFPNLKSSWIWPWRSIGSYCISACITHRLLPTRQISLKSKKLFVDGRTNVRKYARTDIWDRLHMY